MRALPHLPNGWKAERRDKARGYDRDRLLLVVANESYSALRVSMRSLPSPLSKNQGGLDAL
jgi:hypothetical protein